MWHVCKGPSFALSILSLLTLLTLTLCDPPGAFSFLLFPIFPCVFFRQFFPPKLFCGEGPSPPKYLCTKFPPLLLLHIMTSDRELRHTSFHFVTTKTKKNPVFFLLFSVIRLYVCTDFRKINVLAPLKTFAPLPFPILQSLTAGFPLKPKTSTFYYNRGGLFHSFSDAFHGKITLFPNDWPSFTPIFSLWTTFPTLRNVMRKAPVAQFFYNFFRQCSLGILTLRASPSI